MDKKQEFINKLKALLKEYNASVEFSVGKGSDTYGLYDEELVIKVDDKIAAEVSGWYFDSSDLK